MASSTRNSGAGLTCRSLFQSLTADDLGDLLATSLNNQSNRLSDLGRREQALAVGEEAVTIRRALSDLRPAVFASGYANSLDVKAQILSGLGNAQILSGLGKAQILSGLGLAQRHKWRASRWQPCTQRHRLDRY